MANDPKFVRLPDRLTTGSLAHLDSGWFIGGSDIKEFPDPETQPHAANFVRDKLRQGHLEPAAKAEFEEVQKATADLSKLHVQHLDDLEAHDRPGHQEALYQTYGQQSRGRLEKLRRESPPDEEEVYEEEPVGYTRATGGVEGPVDSDVTPTGAKKARGSRKSQGAQEAAQETSETAQESPGEQ